MARFCWSQAGRASQQQFPPPLGASRTPFHLLLCRCLELVTGVDKQYPLRGPCELAVGAYQSAAPLFIFCLCLLPRSQSPLPRGALTGRDPPLPPFLYPLP
ncbi:hypothetical protein LX36DRAFT_108989 [Colletotrichum falcatum]|nr:hypothetical protein LX36DRAFT_108989 [Colletotrichum falcatum]